MNNKCPVCGSNSIKIMDFEKADIFECTDCTHAFSLNIKLSCEEVYNENYFLENHKNFFKYPDIKLYKKIASNIQSQFDKNVSILDIGCGTGNFLFFLKSMGFNNLSGVDFIRNDDKDNKINFIQSDLFEYFPNSKFDVIVSNMNIEHIEDLNKYIKKIETFLNPDGIIIINTINEHSLLYKIAKIFYKLKIKFVAERLYDPHHVNHFSKRSLEKLFYKYNYESKRVILKNYPIKAIDISSNNIILSFIQKFGVIAIFLFSNLMKNGVSQTQFFKKVSSK